MAQLHSVNPFLSNLRDFDAREAFGFDRAAVEPVDDGAPTGYALIKNGPAPTSEECENLAARAVEVTALWGTNVIHVAHLDPPRAFRVGENSSKECPCELTLPAEKIGCERLSLVEVIDGEPCAIIPAGATATIGDGIAASPGATIPLVLGTRLEVRFGDIVVRIAGVHPGKKTARRFMGESDSAAFGFFGLSALIAASFVGAMAAFVPALGLNDEEGIDNERNYMVQQYLEANAERNKELDAEEAANTDREMSGGERAEAAAKEPGTMGKPSAPIANKRAGVAGPKDNPTPEIPRERLLAEARDIGMIGLLNTMNSDPNAPTSPFGSVSAIGKDDISAMGNMWGDELGDANGSNGLGLSGVGEGGGGKGVGIGLGGVGTCGGTICAGLEGGFGRSFGHGGPGHVSKGPKLGIVGATSVSGHLPAEVIQRVVRQNYGRFRQCYETGLGKNPNLAGRVSVRFVIGRDGAVSNVSNSGSDLPDSGVVSCVVGAYYGLSFPSPDNGIVTVSYPIMFSPG